MTARPASARSDHEDAPYSGDLADIFSPQRTPTAELPAPEPVLVNLTVGVLEVLAGVRDAEQLARWLSEDAFRVLVARSNLSARARNARGAAVARPVHTIASVRHSSPADGAVEGVVIVTTPARTRAVVIRLDGFDRRWRATSLGVL